MKNKILATVGALISLFISACGKPETVTQNDDITIEDYTNSIIEYDEYEDKISFTVCTKYGAHQGECENERGARDYYKLKKRCLANNKEQCECSNDGEIHDCSEHIYATGSTFNKVFAKNDKPIILFFFGRHRLLCV